jgi:hypothetical protein
MSRMNCWLASDTDALQLDARLARPQFDFAQATGHGEQALGRQGQAVRRSPSRLFPPCLDSAHKYGREVICENDTRNSRGALP